MSWPQGTQGVRGEGRASLVRGSPQGLRVRPRERCDMSGPSQPQPRQILPNIHKGTSWLFSAFLVSNPRPEPRGTPTCQSWSYPQMRRLTQKTRGKAHDPLFVSSGTESIICYLPRTQHQPLFHDEERWGWGGGSERKGRKEGRRRRKKDHFSKSVLLIHLAATVYQYIWYTWLQLGPSVSSVSLYLPFTHAINCVFLHQASIGNHQLSPRDKLNQVLRAFFSLQLTRRLAYIRGASLRALCDHKQGCSRMYTPNYAFTCSLETLVIMFYYWSPPQHNELWWNNETALAPEQSGWRPPQLRPPMRTIARAEHPAPVAASGRKSWQPAPPSPPPAPAPTAGPAPWVTEMPRPIGNEAQAKKAGVQGVGEQKSSMGGGHNHPSITLFCADGETEAQKGETTPPNAHSGGGGLRSQISCLLIECVSSARFFS